MSCSPGIRLLLLLALLAAAPAPAESDWIRAGANTNQPVWGIRGGLLWAVAPAGFRPGEPRGLIRLGYPVLSGKRYDLINFIAVEPIVRGRRGFSELERSQLDGVAGKRIWAETSGGTSATNLVPGQLRKPPDGHEELQVGLQVEKFENGAHVLLKVLQRSARPDEIELSVFQQPDSAPLEYCILTATMGNMARTRQLWLEHEVVSSLEVYPDYRGTGFALHRGYPVSRLHRTAAGGLLVAVTNDEEDPASVYPFPNSELWHYAGSKVTQYWAKEADSFRDDLHVAVNGRYAYWRSSRPIPGGIAFENFELRERFYDGQVSIFGITRKTPQELGFQDNPPKAEPQSPAGQVTAHSDGLHGYIGFSHQPLPPQSSYGAGMGFYAAVWSLVQQPLADFQIGLPSVWITPDNSDNKDKPLAPEGTLARTWRNRGPTWSSVFQTVEGGLGYWAGNHFRYGSPKFSMNATPQAYDYEIGSPGWSFFYSNEALPDYRLGIAQLSNRLLIPPDALPFQGHPNGEFLGYTWMALPFTEATAGDPATGDQSWTCFLSAANFKGPIAYYVPETWSKIGKLFKYPFIYGRGLDARPGVMGGGAMEINTVPRFDGTDAHGTVYSKLPKLEFPVEAAGRAWLVQDVTYYSRAALYDGFKTWRDGGPACSGRFDAKGAWKPKLTTQTTRYDQAGKRITGVERVFDTRIFDGNIWGLQWFTNNLCPQGLFPQYYKQVREQRIVVAAADVPPETRLLKQEFKLAKSGNPYTSPAAGAWSQPGPKLGPFTAKLADGSVVTYSWYRFVDQPSFQQYEWSAEKKARLQAFVERLHAQWPIDRDYMAPPTRGTLVTLHPALLVTPPRGLEVGYVPIVTGQAGQ